MVYLDHAAATPVSTDVLAAMLPYYSEKFYNPSATYLLGREARADLESARKKVAGVLGVKPSEIIFTAGGTEANNLAVQGILRHPALANDNCSVAVSGIEHDSVLKTTQLFNCSVALTTEKGRVDLEDLRQKITDQTVLVSVMYANNEVGTVQPIRQIATLIQTIRAERSRNNNNLPLYLHTDACQAPNYLDMHVTRLGVDLMTLNGGKIYGPKQSGVLFVASHVRLAPLIHGGGQERDLRSGTENVAQAIGFALALENAQAQRKAESVRLAGLQRKIWSVIKKDMPSVRLNGSLHRRLPNNIHLTFSGHDNEKLLMQLEEAGFLVAVGSACSASSEEPNHVLRAMGISGVDAQSSLRITLGRDTTESGIDSFLAAIQNIVSANN